MFFLACLSVIRVSLVDTGKFKVKDILGSAELLIALLPQGLDLCKPLLEPALPLLNLKAMPFGRVLQGQLMLHHLEFMPFAPQQR
mmetsp:Transcript_14889/g.35242  ORF Transcript_14889/g.35242 Transcript_14889/m.35242 type:complete len:85 (+) Transcript_14889:334-588(+)